MLRVRLHIHCAQPRWGQHNAHCDERWTLGRRGSSWQLLSVSGDPLAGPVLKAPFVTDPSADSERLTEESLAELSMADQISSGVALSELVSPEEPPSLALADLSVVEPQIQSLPARGRTRPPARGVGDGSHRLGSTIRGACQSRIARCTTTSRQRPPPLRPRR